MTRRWRFLVFPSNAGMFVVPPLTTTILTSAGVRRELRCEQRALMVQEADATAAQPRPPAASGDARLEAARRSMPFFAIAAALLIILAMVWPRLTRASFIRRETRGLLRETPAATRAAVDEWLSERGTDSAALLRETSERGDAHRALRSLLDAAERDRLVAEPQEIRGRVRDLVASV